MRNNKRNKERNEEDEEYEDTSSSDLKEGGASSNKKKQPKTNKKKKIAKKACFHCKKGHRKCGDERPCFNCIRSKKECFDVPIMKVQFIEELNQLKLKNIQINNFFNSSTSSSTTMQTEHTKTFKLNISKDSMNQLDQRGNNHGHLHGNNYDGNNYKNTHANFTPNTHTHNHNHTHPHNKSMIYGNKYEESNEINRLKSEIEEIQKEIEEIDQIYLPDTILNYDPIELFIMKESTYPDIPSSFLSPYNNDPKMGTMYMVGYYKKNILPQHYNPINFIIESISENASSSFGLSPSQMMGQTFDKFCPKYSINTFEDYGMSIFEMCKNLQNFVRIIDYGINSRNNEIFAFDCNTIILRDEFGKPSYCIAFFKKITKLEIQFSADQLRPIIREL